MSEIEPPELSARDREVLTLLTWGCTNPQVAAELDVSIASAKSYIHLAYLKIGVTRRTQAVVWGVRNGLLSTPTATSAQAPVAES